MNAQTHTWQEMVLATLRKDWRISIAVAAMCIAALFIIVPDIAPHTTTPAQTAAQAVPATATATATPLPTATPVPTVKPAVKSTKSKEAVSAPKSIAPTPTLVPPTVLPNTQTGEAATPLHLSDPSALTTSAALPSLSAVDILWRLMLVVALIYLVIRALAFFKQKGFTSSTHSKSTGKNGSKNIPSSFFEMMEEIKISPQMALFAVRAGNRVLLLLRNGSAVQTISEFSTDDAVSDELPSLPPESFSSQLVQAWATGMIQTPLKERKEQTVEMIADCQDAAMRDVADEVIADHADFIDADWTQLDTDAIHHLIVKKDQQPLTPKPGVARPAEKSPQTDRLDPALEREILYYAEQHGAGAAARQYGLPHQRITAMRNRFERERNLRKTEAEQPAIAIKTDKTEQDNVREFRPSGKKSMVTPDHPRRDKDETSFVKPRSSLIQATYGKTSAPQAKQPDVATKTDPASDTVATSIAQTLAERFNIKLPQKKA